MRITKVCVAILIVVLSRGYIPEVNLAASMGVLNQQMANFIGPKVVDIILNTTIDTVFSQSASYGLVKVDVNVSNITIDTLDIYWKNGILVPKSDYTFRLNSNGISAKVNAHIQGHVSLKKFNTTVEIQLSGINGYTDMKLLPPKTSNGVGFILQVSYIEIQVDNIDIKFIKDPIDTYVAQTVATLIRKSIPQIVNSLVSKQINPLLQNICESRAFVTAEIGNHLYEINLNTTQVPRFINLTYFAVPLDIMIVNVDTGKFNQEVDNQQLPLKSFPQNNSLEATISSAMVNTILWLAQDSNLVDVYVDNSKLGDLSPIALNTSDLSILIPEITRYGTGKGVYIHITLSTRTPNLYIRGGRIMASISVNLEFIVDQFNALYPRNASECLRNNECDSVTTLNASIVSSIALKINNQNQLYGVVQTAKIIEVKPIKSKISVNEQGLKRILNTLVPSIVSQVNQQLRDGIDVPLAMIYGYNITNLMLKTEQDYLSAALIFDFN